MQMHLSLCGKNHNKSSWLNGLVLFVALTTIFFTGCSNKPVAQANSNIEIIDTENVKLVTKQNPTYTILPGDELEIKFLYHPEFNMHLEVMPDGRIFLPLIHGVTVTNKTPGMVVRELEEFYDSELKNPDIVVNVRRSTGNMIYVGGEVKEPQAINVKIPTTLWQAIISSGGMLRSAEESNILIIRAVPGEKTKILCVNLNSIHEGRLNDILLQPYDLVYVPKTNITKVGEFVENYINKLIPRNMQLLFTYEIHRNSQVKIVP